MVEPAPGVGWIPAFIGLGSNLDGPIEQVRRALDALASLTGSRLVAASGLYRSDPVGPPAQPDYVNAVARIETRLSPGRLLDELQRIERQQGRVRGPRWGPRTLDLDLQACATRVLASRLVTGVDGEAPDPRVPGVGIAQGLEVLPCREQCVLDRVLGPIGVAEDEARQPEQSPGRGPHQLAEGVVVAGLRPLDERSIHGRHRCGAKCLPALITVRSALCGYLSP